MATGNAAMLWGQTEQFAIEIGAAEARPEFRDVYVQFRFWVAGVPLGDWSERISLSASTHSAALFRDLEPHRRRAPFDPTPPAELFQQVYDAYFSLSCFPGHSGGPDPRALHHLDPIGMGALRNLYGLILIASADGRERILAKDLTHNHLVAETSLPPGTVHSTLGQYIAWGKERLREVRG